MSKLISNYLILLLAIFPYTISGQNSLPPSEQLLSSKELKKDFQLLKTGLEKTHAGLYTYVSKDSLSSAFDKIEQSLNSPMTSIDFYRKITPLLKLIGNGHTNFLVPTAFNTAINSTLPRIPFAVHWHRDTLYVLRNLSDEASLSPGTIIKSINGEAAGNIMKEMSDNLTRDGYNESKPLKNIERDFSGKYAVFKGTPTVFEVAIINQEGGTETLTINGLTTNKLLKHSKERYPNWRKPKGKPLQFKIVNGVGQLTVRSFHLPIIKKAGQKYKPFFKTTFQQIKAQKVSQLIIDIRDNGGGYPEVVNELFSYLIDQTYTHKSSAHTITNKLPNRKYYKDGLWDNLDMVISLKLKKEGNIYKVRGDKKHEIVQPAKNTFQGKVYVLTNPFTFSAASDFMGMLKNVNLGTFIGETAGGNPHQTTTWIMTFLDLPNTKIRAIIPVVSMQVTNKFPNDKLGIQPDYFVKNTVEEQIQGKDAVVDFVFKLIEQQSNN